MKDLVKYLQLGLLGIILVSTIIAVVLEIKLMFINTSVTLADLLLMFLYLEVLAMVRVFWDQQSISITLPLLIAITALSRFIILQGKEMDPSALVYEAVAIVLIAGAIVILRLRHSDKLGISKKKKDTINILTHCNAGWLATIDWGTATSPIYHAHKKGIKVHVWVDETRPRNQGANLTSYELNEEGISNTIITDNAGGILMQRGQVDMCIVGTDRTLSNGDVCNKIGTYLKALAAHDNKVPFYVALPSSTIDWNIKNSKDIPIEERNSEELSHVEGLDKNNKLTKVLIYPEKSQSMNLAFDITPAKYVTGLITEKGVCNASKEGLESLFK